MKWLNHLELKLISWCRRLNCLYFFLRNRRIDDVHTNGGGAGKSIECVSSNCVDGTQNADSSGSGAYGKRPVSMYETREGPNVTKSQQNHDSNRTANSMYQMVDGQTKQSDGTNNADYAPLLPPTTTTTTATTNGVNSLPHSDEVKHRTEIVTRRIQELWSLMQEMTSNNAFIPGAERIRIAVTELTAIFPAVNIYSYNMSNDSIRHSNDFFFAKKTNFLKFCYFL